MKTGWTMAAVLTAVGVIAACNGGPGAGGGELPQAGGGGGSSGSVAGGAADAGGGSRTGPGGSACKGTYPASQGPSEPCCPDWGADACGANLFCAAFDGRTQATCYPAYSRLTGQSCTANDQCLSALCAGSPSRCAPMSGQPCDPAVGCGAGPTDATKYFCDATVPGSPVCRACGTNDTLTFPDSVDRFAMQRFSLVRTSIQTPRD